MKKLILSLGLLLTTQILSENYIVTLDPKNYKDYVNIDNYNESNNNPQQSPQESVSAGLGTPAVTGWTNFSSWGNPSISDEDFVQAVIDMQVGIKIVNGTSHAFISANKLRNANCFNITQVTSLRHNNGQSYPNLFHQEASGCSHTGLDYDKLYITTYNPIYNHRGYWDEIVGSFSKDSNTKYYIY